MYACEPEGCRYVVECGSPKKPDLGNEFPMESSIAEMDHSLLPERCSELSTKRPSEVVEPAVWKTAASFILWIEREVRWMRSANHRTGSSQLQRPTSVGIAPVFPMVGK